MWHARRSLFSIPIVVGFLLAACSGTAEFSEWDVVDGLEQYAVALQQEGRDQEAATFAAGAAKLRRMYAGQEGSVFLGFNAATALRDYAALLRKRGQTVEAERMAALAEWDEKRNIEAFKRQLQHSQ